MINNDKNNYYIKQLHHSSIVYNHSQIIPSATRTKVDKIRTVRKIRERRMRSDEVHEDSHIGNHGMINSKNQVRTNIAKQYMLI